MHRCSTALASILPRFAGCSCCQTTARLSLGEDLPPVLPGIQPSRIQSMMATSLRRHSAFGCRAVEASVRARTARDGSYDLAAFSTALLKARADPALWCADAQGALGEKQPGGSPLQCPSNRVASSVRCTPSKWQPNERDRLRLQPHHATRGAGDGRKQRSRE